MTGGGSTESAAAFLLEQIGEANGNVIQALEIWQSAPNEEFHGISDPIEIARRAGATLTLP